MNTTEFNLLTEIKALRATHTEAEIVDTLSGIYPAHLINNALDPIKIKQLHYRTSLENKLKQMALDANLSLAAYIVHVLAEKAGEKLK